MRDVLIGSLFIALPIFGIFGPVLLICTKRAMPPGFVAAVLLVLPYAHFAYSRADVNHLAQGIFPFLIGVTALASRASGAARLSWISMLLAASVVIMVPRYPLWQRYMAGNWSDVDVTGDELTVEPGTAVELAVLSKLVERYAPNGQPFIATPFWPGAYAAFSRKSPMWEIYALFPRSPAFQKKEIDRIKEAEPRFAVIVDYALDGREELRFKNTHALIDRYIKAHYTPSLDFSHATHLQIYTKQDR